MGPRLVPDRADTPLDRAAHWAVRDDADALDAAEQAEFEAWLTEPGSADAYARARDALDVFDDLDGIDLPGLDALRQEAQVHRTRRPWLPWAAGGAIAAGVAGVLGFTLLDQPAGAPQATAPQVAKAEPSIPEVAAPAASGAYATAIGEQRVLVLADGSRVTMNTGSQVTVDFRADRRIVRLVRGQALFDVAHNPKRPFSVAAGDRVVTALGTMFEVQVGRGQLHVTLMRGKVVIDPPRAVATTTGSALPAAQAPTYLAPGQQFTVTVRSAPEVHAVDVNRQLLWRQQLVEFDDAPVSQAVAELNRYSLKPIVIADPRVGRMRISGVYKTGDPNAFADLVSTMLPVAARDTNRGEIELYPSSGSTQ